MSATTALFVGALAMHGTYKYVVNEDRYPLRAEYEIVDACVSGARYPMSQQPRRVKTEICLCALERTAADMSYSEIRKSEPEFLARFRQHTANCGV